MLRNRVSWFRKVQLYISSELIKPPSLLRLFQPWSVHSTVEHCFNPEVCTVQWNIVSTLKCAQYGGTLFQPWSVHSMVERCSTLKCAQYSGMLFNPEVCTVQWNVVQPWSVHSTVEHCFNPEMCTVWWKYEVFKSQFWLWQASPSSSFHTGKMGMTRTSSELSGGHIRNLFSRVPGEGNGNPLQYYCLENPMDRGAW